MLEGVQLVKKATSYHKLVTVDLVQLKDVVYVIVNSLALNVNKVILLQAMVQLPHQHASNATNHVNLVSNLQSTANLVLQDT